MRRALFGLLVVTLASVACSPSRQPEASAASAAYAGFDQWLDAFTEEWARTSPQVATRIQYFTGDEQHAPDGQLSLLGEWGNIFGVTASTQRAALARRGLTDLGQFDRRALAYNRHVEPPGR